jgi:hypothetical protein
VLIEIFPVPGCSAGMAGLWLWRYSSRSKNTISSAEIRRRKMNKGNNFFQRALNSIVEGRTRQAQRYLAQYDRDHGHDAARKLAR